MQTKGNKLEVLAILVMLLLTTGAATTLLPAANAHSPPWTIISYAYLSVAPQTVGVGQTVAICFWVDTPMMGATIQNDIRRHDYTLTIAKPDGTTLTQNWPVEPDPTGVQFYRFTPDKVGNYTITFNYGGQVYTWNSTNSPGLSSANAAYQNDIITPSSKTVTLTVQQEQIATPLDSYPLPTEFWSYPIEGQNTYWYTISSNYLGAPFILGANQGRPGSIQPDGTAPNSAHVMWTKPVQFGGLVGGTDTTIPGEMFYQGLSYNPRFKNPLIMQGILFYQEPYGNSGDGGPYIAVDLQTGQELWRVNTTATGMDLTPQFGYLYSLENINQHGTLPNGLLIASSTVAGQGTVWRAYDPRTGVLTGMNITNVPGGSNIGGPSGEYLKYILSNFGTSANPKYNLMLWNSSNVFGVGDDYGTVGGTLGVAHWYDDTVNASLPSAYNWNVSLTLPPGTWSIGADAGGKPLVSLGNLLLLVQGSFGGHPGDSGAIITTNPGNITAISLNPVTLGQVLWTKTYPPAPGNNTRTIDAWDPSRGVFIFTDKETFERWGYSLTSGNLLWGPTAATTDIANQWSYMMTRSVIAADGRFFYGGYSGLIYCYNDTTGELLWVYGNGGPGNSTFSGLTTPYGHYPTFVVQIADGKIYTVTDEHSPTSPLYKGGEIRVLNVTNGAELWAIFGWGNDMNGDFSAVASGYLAMLNPYDMQIYTYGKGPTAISVDAPMASITQGSSLVIRGTVTDISAGTKQKEQATRFPNGVPAVSDASMSEWMEYVYMQKPRPTDTVGVDVKLTITDPNNNTHDVIAASDALGTFSVQWTPPVPGHYTVTAQFQGTQSYWPSEAETSFAVDAKAPAPSPIVTSPTPPPTQGPTPSPIATATPSTAPSPTGGLEVETYVAIAAVIAIVIVAIAAVFVRMRK